MTSFDEFAALACGVATSTLAIPTQAVEAVVEVAMLERVPLSRAHFAGLAQHQGRIAIVVDLLERTADSTRRRLVKGVLLATANAPMQVIFEVSAISALTRVVRTNVRPESIPTTWPRWVLGGRDMRSAPCAVLDVEGMIEELTSMR